MSKSIVNDKSFEFVIRIVKLYKYLMEDKKECVFSKQILRNGINIDASINELLQGQRKKDFLMNKDIAFKEYLETKYWIKLLCATDYTNQEQEDSIFKGCIEFEKMLTSIVKKRVTV